MFLQVGTAWDVQTVLVIAGIAGIFFGVTGFLVVPKVGFQPLTPRRAALLAGVGVALLVLGLVLAFSEEKEQRSVIRATPSTPHDETSAPVTATFVPMFTPTPTLLPPTQTQRRPTPTLLPPIQTQLPPAPTPCPLVSGRPTIGEPPPDLTATISDPAHCQQDLPSGEAVTVQGAYSGDLTGTEIWLLVYPPDGKYYPQSACDTQGPVAASARQQWVTVAHLGPKGVAEQFDLVVVVTSVDSEASRDFRAWLQTGCDTGDFPGFVELPGGLAEMDAITVRTRG